MKIVFLTALPSDRGAITKSAKLLDNTNAKNKMIQGQIMTFTSTLARGRLFLGRHNAIETNRGNFYIKISVCSCRNAYNDRIVTVVDWGTILLSLVNNHKPLQTMRISARCSSCVPRRSKTRLKNLNVANKIDVRKSKLLLPHFTAQTTPTDFTKCLVSVTSSASAVNVAPSHVEFPLDMVWGVCRCHIMPWPNECGVVCTGNYNDATS